MKNCLNKTEWFGEIRKKVVGVGVRGGMVLCACVAPLRAGSFEDTPATERVEGRVYPTEDGREIYWPKAFVAAADVYEGRVHRTPMDRRADVSPDWEGFAKARLKPAPAPGVHPRVLITPEDVEQIRANIAKGEEAPRNFRMVWDLFKRDAGVDAKTGTIGKVDQKTNGGPGWMEEWSFTKQALYALISGDEALGKELSTILTERAVEGLAWVKQREAELHPAEAENFWSAFGNKHSWLIQFAQEYDYLHGFMSEAQRTTVRDFIAYLVRDRISHGYELPANKHIINHEIMAWKWLLLPMAIEGEPGFDQGTYSPKTVLEFGMKKFREVPEWYISPSGVMYENVKGHMPKSVLVALARRDGGAMLAHPHITAAVDYTARTVRNLRTADVGWVRPPIRLRNNPREQAFWNPENAEMRRWTIGGGQFGSSFDPWVMSYLYPENKAFDLVFKSYNTMMNYDFWDQDQNTWINPVWDSAIHLWTAHDGLTDETGAPIDWNQTPIDFQESLSFSDPERGVAEMAAGTGKDDLRLRIEARSDAYTGGHESPEFGNFTVTADGVSWAPYQGPYQPVIARNVVTIDGFSGLYPPVPARFQGLSDSAAVSSLVLDYAEALQFTQPGKTWLIDSPGLNTEFHKWMQGWSGWDFDRDMQLPFMPHLRWLNEGKASTDFSHWDGQNPWPQYFKRVLDPVEKAWRSLNLIRGAHPYVFVMDDVQMDDQLHDYRWNFNLQREMVLVRQPDDFTFIVGRGDIEWQRTGAGPGAYANSGLNWKRTPKKGEPLLMVKVLNVNAATELPAPAFEYSKTWPRIVVPARTVAPDYRVMVYPFREGDPEPTAVWSEDRSRLTVRIGDQVDQYDFAQADGGRSVFVLSREGEVVHTAEGVPPRPTFAELPPVHRGTRYDRDGAELGPPPQVADADPLPVKVFTDRTELAFTGIVGGQDVRYTTDGSEPTETSPRYEGPVTIDATATVKARTFARGWRFGENASPVVSARFVKQSLTGPTRPTGPTAPGLRCEVFETFTAEWDRYGFMRPDLNMLPDLNKLTPILDVAVRELVLPPVLPQRESREQFKGFYRFTGFLEVPADGVYTFRVQSMAPLQLRVGGASVIDETGPYHQDLKMRYGQVALAAGTHAFTLVAGDSAFWRMSQLGPMDFAVAWSREDSRTFRDIPAEAFSSPYAAKESAFQNPFAPVETELPLCKAVKADTVPGLVLKTYDRTALAEFASFKQSKQGAAEGLLDLEGVKPVAVERVTDLITGSNFDGELKVYEGYYHAPFTGVYAFQLDGAGNNALQVGGDWVVANNIPGLRATGRVRLEQGLHPLKIFFGRSGGLVKVKSPVNRDFQSIAFPDLSAPAGVAERNAAADWLVLENPLPGKPLRKTPLRPEGIKVHESVKVVNDPEKGEVLAFDGSGGIELTDVPMVRDEWTLSFWMKREADTDMDFLRPKEEGVIASWWRGSVTAGPPRRASTGLALSREIPLGEWMRVTITADETLTVYINGEKRARTWYDPNAGTHTQLLFRRSEAYTLFGNFKGQVSELKFWNAIVPPEADARK